MFEFQHLWWLICSIIIIVHPWIVYPDDGGGLRLLEMSVPSLADPRDPLRLSCHFTMGGEELNSVKWYKDEEEFFRYMPLQNPAILTFPVAGVHLRPVIPSSHSHNIYYSNNYNSNNNYHRNGVIGDDKAQLYCSKSHCTIELVNLTRVHSSGAYKCEISSEGPTFRVVFSTTNVTVAAIPKERPRVTGLKAVYHPGDIINVSCMSSPSEPPSTISFLINGKPPPQSGAVSETIHSHPDQDGLVASSATMKIPAEKSLFLGPSSAMELRCVSQIPAVPQIPPHHTALTTIFKSPHSYLSNQTWMEWSKNSGSRNSHIFSLYLISYLMLQIF
ncbi:uncharacterized protein LOC123296345 [Chrysoperla carnea]|uniref:uncharacterized protein LOC123296345 n=1 Tax=Chrysoperla carnea TaxID=189513 RepID=UPI001D06B0C6|nr:uncharacterized protein LOC123296345 [Chrysoperla carnea]